MREKADEDFILAEDIQSTDQLFGSYLKPLRSKNARLIFLILLKLKDAGYLTTHDLQNKLKDIGYVMNKKEINGWLKSLLDSELIVKEEERGKPSIIKYEDKYTFDEWKLSEIGINIGSLINASLNLVEYEPIKDIGNIKLEALNEDSLETIEDLYVLSKLLVTLKKEGGQMQFNTLRKKIQIAAEKLAMYSWPDSSWSEKPIFKISKNKPTMKSKLLKLFGYMSESDLTFSLTDEGSKIAEKILKRNNFSLKNSETSKEISIEGRGSA